MKKAKNDMKNVSELFLIGITFELAFFHCDNSVIECMYVRRAELLALRNFLDGLSVMIKAFSQLSKAHKMELRAEAIERRTFLQKSSLLPRNKKESRIDTIFSLSSWICAKKFKTFS